MTGTNNNRHPARLPGLDAELSAEARAQLGNLETLERMLSAYEVSDPTPEDSGRLLARLRPLMVQATRADVTEDTAFGTLAVTSETRQSALPEPFSPVIDGWRGWLRLALTQIELLQSGFWLACLLIVVVGMGVASSLGTDVLTVLFILSAPVLAAAGVAYAFWPETRGLRDLETISAIGWLELLYMRLGVVLGITTLIALVLLTVVGASGTEIALWRMSLVWFGPMIGLAGLALYTSVRWNPVVGTGAPLAIWSGLMTLGWREATMRFDPSTMGLFRGFAEWVLAQIATSDTLLLAAGAALLAGVLLILQTGRYVAHER